MENGRSPTGAGYGQVCAVNCGGAHTQAMREQETNKSNGILMVQSVIGLTHHFHFGGSQSFGNFSDGFAVVLLDGIVEFIP